MSPEYQRIDRGDERSTFTVTSGPLPPGVTFNSSTGVLSSQRIDQGVVPHTPSRLPTIVENVASASTVVCLILMAVTNNVLWLAPTLPMLGVAMICQKVRSK